MNTFINSIRSSLWGALRLCEVKPIAVEKWLSEMPVAPATQHKTKGVMSVLFQHAMRHEGADRNPIRLFWVERNGPTRRDPC